MKFRSKIIAFAAAPTLLFVIALISSISALITTRSDFDAYIKSEQAVERGLSEMYAQGLQMGQALRNVILNPSNPKALDNLKAAQGDFEQAMVQTRESVKGSRFEAAFGQLPELRAAQAAAQEKVLALVASNGDAIALLNSDETPAWRKLKGELLQQKQAAVDGAKQAYQKVTTQTDNAIKLSLGLALIAALTAIGLNVLMITEMRKELGGDPADAREALSSIARGNLASNIVNMGNSDSLMGVMREMQASLTQVVGSVREGSESVSTASSEIAQGNHDLSARTEQQASALEETAASMEELSATVKQNADNAKQANQLAQSASTVAIEGGNVVGQVVQTMKGINDASKKISDIIGVIDGIAFQTNILALNAAVEAARAGEQGRGFAVVASEVRSLAGRSADAAKEIKALIGDSVNRVEQGSALVDQAGVTMAEVVSSIKRVTDLMGEISAASNEQSLGVSQVGEAVTQMDRATQQNAALVEEMAAAASSLKSQAQDLVETVAVFKLGAGDVHQSVVSTRAVRFGQSSVDYAGTERRDLAVPISGDVGINLDNAIKAHADWRTKLRTAATKNGHIDAETISRDNCCEMGKWLHGAGGTKFGGSPTFVNLIEVHQNFHTEAGKIAQKINQGDGDQATQMLGSGSSFSQASNEVTRLIIQFKGELRTA
jgi:methyl-accepting chemotaxis protein